MESCKCVMALVAFLASAAAATFFMMVVGVHRGDRAWSLSDAPATALDALTRKALGLAVRR